MAPSRRLEWWVVAAFLAVGGCRAAQPAGHGATVVGRRMSPSEVSLASMTVFPGGRGLPAGHGTAREGRDLYAALCASCHGPAGEGLGDFPALVGGKGTLSTASPRLTVGSYWPTATTVFDYVRRAMPYSAPGSLSDDQVYALTAWLLAANEVIPADADLDAAALLRVEMPNRDGFIRGAE
jgi:S-disulfanyl-L-cysteine oxidoreductase SoxD